MQKKGRRGQMAELKNMAGKLGKYKYPILVFLIGLLLLLMPNGRKTEAKSSATDEEQRFERVLESSQGVGNASVLISEEGVVIVCDGAENSQVKLSILKAAEVFTGFSSDKIEILKTAT